MTPVKPLAVIVSDALAAVKVNHTSLYVPAAAQPKGMPALGVALARVAEVVVQVLFEYKVIALAQSSFDGGAVTQILKLPVALIGVFRLDTLT